MDKMDILLDNGKKQVIISYKKTVLGKCSQPGCANIGMWEANGKPICSHCIAYVVKTFVSCGIISV